MFSGALRNILIEGRGFGELCQKDGKTEEQNKEKNNIKLEEKKKRK